MPASVVWFLIGVAATVAVMVVFRRVFASREAKQAPLVSGGASVAAVAPSAQPAAPSAPRARAVTPAPPAARATERPRLSAPPPPVPSLAQVQPESEEEITSIGQLFPNEDEDTTDFALILVTAVGRTDVGRRRKQNEDSYLVLEDHHLFVVADGMGGHAAGEVASRMAVESIGEAFEANTFGGVSDPRRPRRGDELVRAVETASRKVYDQAQANSEQSGMGTTLVAARFSPGKQRVYIAHVGDSRCYRLRGNTFAQLTKDHTYDAYGVTGAAGAMLTRAVGYEETVEVDLTTDGPQPGDRYVLCSDGLSKMVPDEMIQAILEGEPDINAACQRLIATANERGGKDNVTVILIDVRAMPGLGAA